MKTKKNKLLAIIFALVALSFLVVHAVYTYRADHFSCVSRIIYFKGNTKLTVQVKFYFDGGNGIFGSLGEYGEIGEEGRGIAQTMTFNYIRRGSEIVMISTQSTLSDSQILFLNNMVPDFYLRKDRGLRLRLFRQGDKGYVFMNNDIPSFICTGV
jgi:hypothetical protein